MTCVPGLLVALSMIGLVSAFRFQSQLLVGRVVLPHKGIGVGRVLALSSVSASRTEDIVISHETDNSSSGKQESTSSLKRGQMIKFKVVQFGPLGASVQLESLHSQRGIVQRGLVLQKELAYFRNRRDGNEVQVGELLEGYVERVREDGKVDVSLRPVDRTRVELTKLEVLEALQKAEDGVLNIGDKSSPQEIAEIFKGLSKSDFKHAVGALYKDGLIIPDRYSTKLVPKSLLPQAQSAAAVAQAESRKKRRQSEIEKEGIRSSSGLSAEFIERNSECSIFLGNLPATIDVKGLVTAIHAVILPENIVRIRLCKDQNGIPRGFGYLELAHKNLVEQALVVLKGHEVKGRKLRVDYADREKRFRLAAKEEQRARVDSLGMWSSDEDGEYGDDDEIYGIAARQRRSGPIGLPAPATASTSSLTVATRNNSRFSSAMEAWKKGGGSAADWEEDERWLGKAKPSSNLSFDVTEEVLRDAVKECVGAEEIAAVRVILDRDTGESRGYGFVDVYTTKAAEKIYNEMHDQELMGRKLKVDDATKP